jgi:hypothetical protein
MSFWANVSLGKCLSVNHLSGQMSFWQNVLWANVFLGKCLSGKMFFWENVFLGKCPSGKMSSVQMSYWANIVWANVSRTMLTYPGAMHPLRVIPGFVLFFSSTTRIASLSSSSSSSSTEGKMRWENLLLTSSNELPHPRMSYSGPLAPTVIESLLIQYLLQHGKKYLPSEL